MFIPGETISFQYYIPFVRNDVEKLVVSFKQRDRVILQKIVYPGQIEGEGSNSKVVITLSQEESLLFENNNKFKMQLNVYFIGGARCTSMELVDETGQQHIREVVN